MADVRPFAAVRPRQDLADQIAALPYDVMNTEEARVMTADRPDSFLRIDRAEINFPAGQDPYAPEVYEKAAQLVREMIHDGRFVQDDAPCYYLYALTMNGRTQTGLVGCESIDEYDEGRIKKHELTRADKEEDRVRHIDALDANTGPIFLTYRENAALAAIQNEWIASHEPLYDFTAEDGIRHTVYRIGEAETIAGIRTAVGAIPALYIADGHHRTASAVRVGKMRRAQYPDYDGTEEYNYFLSVIFPADELMIMDYNRVVCDTAGLTKDELLDLLREHFNITEKEGQVRPSKKGTFGMYLAGRWYELTACPDLYEGKDEVSSLDVSILQDNVLTPVLKIGDIRTDARISFVGGIRGLGELERLAGDSGVAFSMYPTSIGELMAIADAGALMPPKSTWFEPKLRSGLFIHELEGRK